ncbi:hypothetical protein [Ruegeria sp. HKCCD8929]|uniref:hypothetical protein n=1 Tax=Ruegeria sp. HKCCD8929 TaxID=2683006 RepID=UPI0020C24EFE|nr:hypothetical protein [Ruegeria sp. HKCCD8929]
MRDFCTLVLAAALIAGTAIAQTSQTGEPTARDSVLRIGVRSDARPFSYRSERNFDVLTAATPGPLANRKYTGFMIKICDAVLTDMLVNPAGEGGRFTNRDLRIVDVDELVMKNPEKSRFEYFGEEFDILCDPATITNDRRSGLILSPPLFLSGISFIDLPELPKPRQDGCPSLPLVGLVGNTTAAQTGIRAVLEADELPRYNALLVDYLNDGKTNCAKEEIEYEAVRIFASHSEAAEAFCDREYYYYLGDHEIITANARLIPGCDFEHSGRTFTTDRYAIFGQIDYQNTERALHVARFFEILSQKVPFSPSILDTAFSDTFIGTEKSRALELFFWSVRGSK